MPVDAGRCGNYTVSQKTVQNYLRHNFVIRVFLVRFDVCVCVCCVFLCVYGPSAN